MPDRLVSKSVAEFLVADDGTMVYAISGLLTPEAKAAAADSDRVLNQHASAGALG